MSASILAWRPGFVAPLQLRDSAGLAPSFPRYLWQLLPEPTKLWYSITEQDKEAYLTFSAVSLLTDAGSKAIYKDQVPAKVLRECQTGRSHRCPLQKCGQLWQQPTTGAR